MKRNDIVKNKVKQNTSVLEVFSVEQLIELWEKTTKKDFLAESADQARFLSNYAAATLDTITATKMVNDLGVSGKLYLKVVNNKQYVVFKGYAGSRKIFNSTRYLATNPKVVDMAIGQIGVNKSIISGARLTIFLIVPLNVLNYVLGDQQTLTELVGKTATDIAKLGIASALAGITATAVGVTTTLAAGPLVAAIAVGIVAGLALDALDKKFGVTDALVSAIDETIDATFGEFSRQVKKVEKQLKWQMNNGRPVGQGIFY